jgi:sulfopyruvate decarboxylase TPP-binding subunit
MAIVHATTPLNQALQGGSGTPRAAGLARMDEDSVRIAIEALKAEGIDLVVTLPEEPTYSLTDAIRNDPYFTALTAASEGSGIALCGGAAFGGRPSAFVTGVAGMLVGAWAMAQVGKIFGAPILILASYRGDFGDATGIPGAQLRMFKQVAEPLLDDVMDFPYVIVRHKSELAAAIHNGFFACQNYNVPVVILLSGEVVA